MATIGGTNGNDVIIGTPQPDLILAAAGDDTVLGLDGNDTVLGLDGNDDLNGNQGIDDLNGNQGNDNVRGGRDNDFVRGGQGNDIVNGNLGDDAVNGNKGDDSVYGGQGNDSLWGGQDNDQLFGDKGNDTLQGDLGLDSLTGGEGADVFVLQRLSGADIVLDFTDGIDRIDLTTNGLKLNELTVSASGNNTVIRDNLTGETLFTLLNVNRTLIDANDFIGDTTGGANPKVNLKGSATDPAANPDSASFNTTTIAPAEGWTGAVQIFDPNQDNGQNSWVADGEVEIVDGNAIFNVVLDENTVSEFITLEITNFDGSIGFTQESYDVREDAGTLTIPFNLEGTGFPTTIIDVEDITPL